MATLNAGATSLAAANWSDATGFATNAELVVADGNQTITTALDQSAAGTGVSYFVVRESFRGNIGAAGDPVIFDADGATPGEFADATVAHFGSGSLYYEAGGGSTQCDQFIQGGSGRSGLEGGTVSALYMIRGNLSASSGTVVTAADISGGRAVFANNATGFTTLTVRGGHVTSRRDCAGGGTMRVLAGATLVLDIPDASPTLTVTVDPGGLLVVLNAATIAALNVYGTVDLRRAKDPTTITALNKGPTARVLRGDSLLTVTAETNLYGFEDAGGAVVGGVF